MHQLQHSEESSSNELTCIIKEEIAKVGAKKEVMGDTYTDEEKSSKHVVKCQIDSGVSCSVISSHSLICKLLQDGNLKLQESKLKLQM